MLRPEFLRAAKESSLKNSASGTLGQRDTWDSLGASWSLGQRDTWDKRQPKPIKMDVPLKNSGVGRRDSGTLGTNEARVGAWDSGTVGQTSARANKNGCSSENRRELGHRDSGTLGTV